MYTSTSTSTLSSTRQRPFDLWLILRAWPHTPQPFLEGSSQAGHVLLESDRTMSTPCPTVLFSNSVSVLLCPARWRVARRAYGLSSLSEKTRKSNLLQMQLQRQHFQLSCLKILSVGQARVRTHDLPHDCPIFNQLG